MPPWLQDAVAPSEPNHPGLLAFRLVLGFILGLTVAEIYRRTRGGEIAPSFRATLVLLTILIAAVTQVIGSNVARAFSLVGALSIVRFRTVVQDTRDTAFVIFAVTVGMAVGAGDLWVAGLTLVVVGTAAAVVAAGKGASLAVAEEGYSLGVWLALGHQAPEVVAPVFQKYVHRSELVAVATASKGAALETTYRIWLRPEADPATLVDEINGLPGIQNVQLRRLESG